MIVGLFALSVVTPAQDAGQDREGPVSVGVLRPDALLIPIAIHDGKEWWNRWPFSHEADESVTRLR